MELLGVYLEAPVSSDSALESVPPEALIRLRRDGEAARDFARESLSPATRRAYQTDVDAFTTWCRGRGVQALPAQPEVVASSPTACAASGTARSCSSHSRARVVGPSCRRCGSAT